MRRRELPIKDYLQSLVGTGKRSSMTAAILYLADSCGYNYIYTKHLVYGIKPITLKSCNRLIQATDGELGYRELLPELYWAIMGGRDGGISPPSPAIYIDAGFKLPAQQFRIGQYH